MLYLCVIFLPNIVFQRDWQLILKSAGAKIVERIFEEKPHLDCVVITPEKLEIGVEAHIRSRIKKLGIPACNTEWVIACLIAQEVVPMKQYAAKLKTEKAHLGEARSPRKPPKAVRYTELETSQGSLGESLVSSNMEEDDDYTQSIEPDSKQSLESIETDTQQSLESSRSTF